jgi:hypothetical protein
MRWDDEFLGQGSYEVGIVRIGRASMLTEFGTDQSREELATTWCWVCSDVPFGRLSLGNAI